jgi:CBS domain-containing membrane protein
MRPVEPVSRIMTEAVVVIESDRPLSEALACFLQYPIHHLPVVRDGKFVGMLSSADLMKVEFFAPRGALDRAAWLDSKFRIEQIMRTPVTSRSPSTSVEDVANLIMDSGSHAITIVDEAERVVGIVTTTDIIRSLLHGPPRRGSMPLSGPASEVPPEDEAMAERAYRLKPTAEQMATALRVAESMYVEGHDASHVGKAALYLDQRRAYLEKVLALADRYLATGQDEHNHALLLKAVLAAKRAEEHATARAGEPAALA